MQVTWSIDRDPQQGIAGVIATLEGGCFGALTRSSIPLVDYWRTPKPNLDALSDALGWPRLTSAELSFERQVPVVEGRGKASFTDLMIISDAGTIAIEAKYTEPPYESVETWLTLGVAANRELVLRGWLARIGEVTGVVLTAQQVESLPYQLIHRTASACSLPSPRHAVVYQVFDPAHVEYYLDHLRTLRDLLKSTAPFHFMLLTVPTTVRPAIPKGAKGEELRELLREPVYEFGQAVQNVIG